MIGYILAAAALGVALYFRWRQRQAEALVREAGRALLALAAREPLGPIHLPQPETVTSQRFSQGLNSLRATLKSLAAQVDELYDRWRTITARMEEGILLLDGRRRVVSVNPAALTILRVTQNQVLGQPLLASVRHVELEGAVQQAMQSGQAETLQLEALPGEPQLEVHLAPLGAEGLLLVVRDITRFKRLEQVRADFVANVSHELQTPLTAIRGFAETLQGGALEDPIAARRFLSIIQSESERMARLIDDLLELSKLESDQRGPRRQQVDLEVLAGQVVMSLAPRAEAAGVEVVVDFPSPWPSVAADLDQMRQVLLNLITNAIKYTPAGGRVVIGGLDRGDQVQVWVQDTGIGVPPEELPRIFERFYRVDKARSRESGGTGLGLAIAKHVIEGHGGRIWADSPGPEQGTTVAFTLAKEWPS